MRALSKTITRARHLRREVTLPEVLLWRALRCDVFATRFRRQHPVGPYVLDFYCSAAKLAVEVDGAAHDHPDRVIHDRERDAWLATRHIRVLRLNAADILNERRRPDVLDAIAATLGDARRPLHHASHGPPPPLRG